MSIPTSIQHVFDYIMAKFAEKNKEYKGGTPDPFRNFTQGAKLSGETPQEVLLGYMNKQIVSLYDAPEYNPERMESVVFIDEKAGDIAVYCIILIAMVREKAACQPVIIQPTQERI